MSETPHDGYELPFSEDDVPDEEGDAGADDTGTEEWYEEGDG